MAVVPVCDYGTEGRVQKDGCASGLYHYDRGSTLALIAGSNTNMLSISVPLSSVMSRAVGENIN